MGVSFFGLLASDGLKVSNNCRLTSLTSLCDNPLWRPLEVSETLIGEDIQGCKRVDYCMFVYLNM